MDAKAIYQLSIAVQFDFFPSLFSCINVFVYAVRIDDY